MFRFPASHSLITADVSAGIILATTDITPFPPIASTGRIRLSSPERRVIFSPARFTIPGEDEDFYPALINAVGPFLKRKRPALNVFNVLMPGDRVELTCGNCQLICHPDKEIRKKRYELLVENGVIVENPDGSREAVPPEEAKNRLAAMDPKTRALYEDA